MDSVGLIGTEIRRFDPFGSAKQDVLAPPFWRDRFGATVLAPTVLAQSRLGATVLAPTVLAQSHFVRPFSTLYTTVIHNCLLP
jgi:hypothetical protein